MAKSILSDMDGVIYRGKTLVDGAKDFIIRPVETRTRLKGKGRDLFRGTTVLRGARLHRNQQDPHLLQPQLGCIY